MKRKTVAVLVARLQESPHSCRAQTSTVPWGFQVASSHNLPKFNPSETRCPWGDLWTAHASLPVLQSNPACTSRAYIQPGFCPDPRSAMRQFQPCTMWAWAQEKGVSGVPRWSRFLPSLTWGLTSMLQWLCELSGLAFPCIVGERAWSDLNG